MADTYDHYYGWVWRLLPANAVGKVYYILRCDLGYLYSVYHGGCCFEYFKNVKEGEISQYSHSKVGYQVRS